jgi:hypothetical protein
VLLSTGRQAGRQAGHMTCRFTLVSSQAPDAPFSFSVPITFHFARQRHSGYASLSFCLFSFLTPVDAKLVTNSSRRLTIDSESSYRRVHMSVPELHSRNTSDEIRVICLCTRGPAIPNVTHRQLTGKNKIH